MEEIVETKLFIVSQFHMKDMGELRYFPGIEVDRSEQGMFLSQRKYVVDILEEYDMVNVRPLKLPMDPHLKLTAEGGSILRDPEPYQKLVGKLIYLTITRPDISLTVHVLSKFMHKPTDIHLQCAKRVLRYLSGSTQQGIFLASKGSAELKAYCDSD
uniref:Reverse transcriptase Ty1/copia-type domain-containing protein n=1 Tax=Chenopodium quinoa TaxID=63459 RepID=A0A803KNI4_CHEQI